MKDKFVSYRHNLSVLPERRSKVSRSEKIPRIRNEYDTYFGSIDITVTLLVECLIIYHKST